MAKKKEARMPDYSGYTLEELAAERRRLALRVNRQMLRFEKKLPDVTSVYSQWAKPYLKRHGRNQFSTSEKPLKSKTIQGQIRAEKAEIAMLNKVISAKTYTIAGYRDYRKGVVYGIAKAAGIKPRSKAFKKLSENNVIEKILASNEWQWLKRTSLGSPLLLEITRRIAQGNATPEEVLSRLNDLQTEYGRNGEFEDLAWEDIIEFVFDDFIEF